MNCSPAHAPVVGTLGVSATLVVGDHPLAAARKVAALGATSLASALAATMLAGSMRRSSTGGSY